MSSNNAQNELLARLARHMMEQVFQDWAAMIGPRVRIVSRVGVHHHPTARMLAPAFRGDCAVVRTRVEGECEGTLAFVFPGDLVIELVGEMIMLPEDLRKKKRAEGLDEQDMEPFHELSNLLCGACNGVFQKLRRQVRVSQSVEHLRVIKSARGSLDAEGEMPAGPLATVRLVVLLQGVRYNVFQAWERSLALDVAGLFLRHRAG